jgi:hypothetical protein
MAAQSCLVITAPPYGPPVGPGGPACGQISHVELRCSDCGQPMKATDIDVLPGPGAASPS